MKKPLSRLLPLLLLSASVAAQDALVFKGTVKCYTQNDERSTRGAKNVVVVPGFVPPKAGMTGPQGYYELNTAAPLQKLADKYVTLYFVSSCRDCEIKKNVFVSDDQVRRAGKSQPSLTVETLQMRAACKTAELKPLQSDSIYNVFAKLPAQDLEKIAPYNVVAATPGVLNVLTNVVTVAAVAGGSSNADPNDILPGRIRYGNFLFASPMNLSGNTGFNFSPVRDLSEAVLWNPAALSASRQTAGVHLFSNLKNHHKATAYARLFDKLWLGAGFLYTRQEEFRPTRYGGFNDPLEHPRRLNEYAAYVGPSYKFSERLSVGAAVKSLWQKYNRPARADAVNDPDREVNKYRDSTESSQQFDADVSFSYSPIPALKIGLNLMNLGGSELDAESYPVRRKEVPVRRLRSAGLGVTYRWKQFNFGTDVLVTQDSLYDVSLGVNYIPLNNVLVAAGYAFKQKSYSASLRIKYFRLTYVNSNATDVLVDERRKGKSGILNGQLHSGLSFTF